MAASIEREYGVKPRLVEGHSGIFDVVADATMIFSNKGACGPLPLPADILAAMRSRLA